MKEIKLNLVLAAAVVFGGFSSIYAAPAASVKNDGSKPAFENLVQLPSAQIELDLPAPVLLAALPELTAGVDRANACTPSEALVPGSSIAPKIEDPVRLKAITELLAKIAVCKPLPYAQDGVTNNNKEGQMPQAPAGFYKEYTLIVPGRKTGDAPEPIVIGGKTYMTGAMLSTRGPERLIIGGGKEIYYTMDHYKSSVHLTIVK
jgi:guanyl-specific ribonuclease Sa